MAAEILLSLFYILLFLWIVKRMNFYSLTNIPFTWIAGAFLLKIISGIILELIYTHYYTNRSEADIFKYFDDSAVIYQTAFNHPKHFIQLMFGINSSADYLQGYYQNMPFWNAPFNELFYNEARTMIRVNALMRFISLGYYNVHVVLFNILSFTGLMALFKAFTFSDCANTPDIFSYQQALSKRHRYLFLFLFVIPSILLWGSGILKESLELFVLGILLYVFVKIIHDKITPTRLLLLSLFLFLHVLIKIYILAAIIPGLVAYFIVAKRGYKNTGLTFLLVHVIYFLILFNLHFVFPAFDVPQLIVSQYNKYTRFAESLHSGSLLIILNLQPTFISLLKNSFEAFFIVLTRPHLIEAKNIFILISSLENFLILLIILWCLFIFLRSKFNSRHVNLFSPLFYFSMSFVVILFILVGLTTPVMGTMVRYKMPALPFLIYILTTIFFQNSLQHPFEIASTNKNATN